MSQRFGWGHININVSNLDDSIQFYRKLGFEVFIPGIPYLNLNVEHENEIPTASAEALGLAKRTRGRAMQRTFASPIDANRPASCARRRRPAPIGRRRRPDAASQERRPSPR